MSYKQIIRMRDVENRQVGGYHHPQSRPRKPLKVSARQYAAQLLRGRLTTRDLELARALIGVGLLTRHQIQRLFFGDHAKVTANRLTKLYDYHFLDRSPYWLEEMGAEGFETCYIYTLGVTGLEAFALNSGMTRQEVPFSPQRYTLSRGDHLLLHDLRISEMFTRLRVGTEGFGWELVWFNESAAMLCRGEEELVRPDGIAVLMGGERQVAFFVEMDRGHTNWESKVEFYERARRQSAWRETLRVDNWQPAVYPAVLCVVPREIETKVYTAVRRQRPQTPFYVKTWETFLTTEMFSGWAEGVSGDKLRLV